jgi:hypothetical protein
MNGSPSEHGAQQTSIQLQYAIPILRESGFVKLRRFLGHAARAVASFCVLFFGLSILVGRPLASDMFSGPLFFAAVSSLIPAVLGFPVLIGVGFISRWIVEKVLKRPLPRRAYVPWLVPALVGLACFAATFLQDRSPQRLFTDRLHIAAPASVTNFDCFWTTLPGDSVYIFSFKINPSEFHQLLVNHPFVQDTDRYEVRQQLSSDISPMFGVRLPPVSLTTVYTYSTASTGNPPSLPQIIDVYTNPAHDQVVIYGDN